MTTMTQAEQDKKVVEGMDTDTIISIIQICRLRIRDKMNTKHLLDEEIMKEQKILVLYQDVLEERMSHPPPPAADAAVRARHGDD